MRQDDTLTDIGPLRSINCSETFEDATIAVQKRCRDN